MSLVISVKQHDDFWVGDKKFLVHDIFDGYQFWVKAHEDGRIVEVTDEQAVELEPSVFISSGGFFRLGQVRLVIEAPRSIEIMRGDRYRDKHGG